MPVTAQELESATLQWAPEDRAHLAQRLIASLEEEAAVEKAGVREAQQRYERYQEGRLETVPAEEVIARLRKGTS